MTHHPDFDPNKLSCADCKHCLLEEYGYSNYQHVWFNRRGEVLACRYLYPDGYATDEERTALRKQALRSLTKAVEDHE